MVRLAPDGPLSAPAGPYAGPRARSAAYGKMGLTAIYQAPRTTIPHPEHRIYKYLLRDMVIDRSNQVWCADITYIPMRRGFLYLVAVMDWATRKVLSWLLSNTMETDFCIEAVGGARALRRSGSLQPRPG